MLRKPNYTPLPHYEEEGSSADQRVEDLRGSVSQLKDITICIGEELRNQNKFLKQVDNNADSVWGYLSNNMQKVKMLQRAGHNNYIYYLLAFALFVFIIIYLLNKLY